MSIDKMIYIQALENDYCRFLKESKVDPLLEDMKANKKHFTFISDGKFSTIGKINHDCDKIAKRVKAQKSAMKTIVREIEKWEDKEPSKNVQEQFYAMARPLAEQAIKYGYCQLACDFLKIMKNPNLVGGYAEGSCDKELLSIIRAYGKRAVLENRVDMFDRVNQVIVDAKLGLYGEESKKIDIETLERAYRDTTVIVGDKVVGLNGIVGPVRDK